MLIKQELINRVRDYFDLNIYEVKVWLALLGKGIASAGEIAQISGVPRSRTYDVLEGLEKRGFAIVKLGKPVKYLGVKPPMILEKMKNNARSDVEEKLQSLSKIKETAEFEQLEELYKEGINPIKREDISAALKGKSNISDHIREIIENAKREVIICTNAQEVLTKSKGFQQTIELLKKANIKVSVALSGSEELIKQVRERFNIKVKKVDIDAKFFIVDRQQILFYLHKDQKDDDIAIWLNSDFFAGAFASLFDLAVK